MLQIVYIIIVITINTLINGCVFLCNSDLITYTSNYNQTSVMATNEDCIRDLQDLRVKMHRFFHSPVLLYVFITNLLGFASDLDKAYRGMS